MLGVRPAVVPFSYYDDTQKTVGYSQDIALAIVAAVKQKLDLPALIGIGFIVAGVLIVNLFSKTVGH